MQRARVAGNGRSSRLKSALCCVWCGQCRYQQFDGIKSAMRGKSTQMERNTDPTLLVVYLNSDSEAQLKKYTRACVFMGS